MGNIRLGASRKRGYVSTQLETEARRVWRSLTGAGGHMLVIPVLGKLRQGLRAGIHEHPTSKGSVCQKLGPGAIPILRR